MISQVNSVNFSYAPLSQAGNVASAPESKALPTIPAHPVNYSNSLTDNGTSTASHSSFGSTSSGGSNTADSNKDTVQKSAQVQQVINQLKARDSEVKAHEMAHLSAAGGYSTGGMSFTYQTGPDGRQYAIGGEVGIDVSAVSGDPQATLQKAMVVFGAALAPAEPSAQDRKVASAATQMMAQARADIMRESQEERKVEAEEQAEKSFGSEINPGEGSETVLNRPLNTASKNDEFLEKRLLMQGFVANSSIENPDRNLFDLRMQFSAGNLLSNLR